jgi:hypothetical protein
VGAVVVLVFIVAAAFALIVVGTVIVIAGIKDEERHKTIIRGLPPPTARALLARFVLQGHFYQLPERRPEHEDPEEEPPWFERPLGPKSR